jgi:beta-aspartyl-peptidase (threonine type)
MPDPKWAIVLHGGAKTISQAKQAQNRRDLLAAAETGAAALARRGSAVEAVEAAIRIMEDAPIFNAGFGSVLNADGEVEMDAALMDGATLDIGGVAALQGVRNPIKVARLMLRERPTLLAGAGARRFAEAKGAEILSPERMISSAALASERDGAADTVGCVALDLNGHIAAGTSTGGLPGKTPGRVGDSPLPGCGLYADDRRGGCSLSGEGEAIARTLLAAEVMQALESLDAQAASEAALAKLARVGGEAGIIVIDRAGRIGWTHNSVHFAVAMATPGRAPRAYLERSEIVERDHG